MTQELAPPLVLVCQDSHGEVWMKFIGKSDSWLPVFVLNCRKELWLMTATEALVDQGYWPLHTAKPATLP